MEGADRPPQVGAEAGEPADLEGGGVGAARPLLRRPVDLDVVDGVAGLVAEEGGEAVEHDGPALVGVHALGLLAALAGEEAHEHAGLAARR